ncbi:MAG: hypothetical protein JOZ96_09925 [Acidobacteria bacterium]|nr:hypothetical protein [Acidobacteriota bacterium]
MKRPFTVYFDTNFFVQLCKAEEAVARTIIEDMNALKVRYVLSNVIMHELISSSDRTDRDKLLVERVSMFQLQPYRTDSYSNLQLLLLSGQARAAVSSFFKLIDDMTTEAESWSIVARQHSSFVQKSDRQITPEENEANRAAALQQANDLLPFLSWTLDFIKESFPNLAESLPETPNPENIKIPDNPSQEDLKAISGYLLGLIGEDEIKQLKQKNQLTDSVTRSEDRPQQVTSGRADAWTRKKLANTLRDAKHMDLFVSHSNEIDLLQVDRPQWNLIKNTKPMHYLVEVGLADQCFNASSLQDAVEIVSKMKQQQ